MYRRDFIRQMGLGLVASWAFGRLSWPWQAWAAGPQLRLALLADAHLKSGADLRPEAQALARAVAEINALTPPPDLVLFAGDLAHKGRADALDLGREILSDLSSPLWAVRGEGDLGRGGASPWVRRFGPPRFSRTYQGVHFLGLDTAWRDTPREPAFEMGPAQLQWLATELAALDSATPLVIVSHAPLARLYLPWQQWTKDAPKIAPLLTRFRQVLCLHGHTHAAEVDHAGVAPAGVRSQAAGLRGKLPPIPAMAKGVIILSQLFAQGEYSESPPLKKGDFGGFAGTLIHYNKFHSFEWSAENRQPRTGNPLHISLPATAWPHPQAVQGTPPIMRPGQGPHGCGWTLITLSHLTARVQPHLWQA
ncbi:MAG: metallophosphoesterase family protein [Desulfobaccales bacterium]